MGAIKAIAKVPVGYGKDTLYVYDNIEVEVLTIHLEKRTARIRYRADVFNKGKMETRVVNIPIKDIVGNISINIED